MLTFIQLIQSSLIMQLSFHVACIHGTFEQDGTNRWNYLSRRHNLSAISILFDFLSASVGEDD